MNARAWVIAGCLFAALGVAAGAFGAHGLESRLKLPSSASEPDRELAARRLHNFEVAVRYQMYHSLALILVGVLALTLRTAWLDVAGWLFVTGIVLFCGMLYGWVLLQMRWLAMVVPLGGTAFLVGWLVLAVAGIVAVVRHG
jgi:uncharacterized membrane protein YgdD (TMEM256/DUF423 family)